MPPRVLSPCRAACPVHTDAGGYARLTADGLYDEAYAAIAADNPFPSVCAHICQRFCEKECRRADVDAPVAIRALKRFIVSDSGAARPTDEPPEPSGGPVAVVGAGPAGLTAARDLRMDGFEVTVFERLSRPGGMLNVIPRYRLPLEAVDADVEAILSVGIDLKCDCEVGRDVSAGELLERGFEAVLVATGLSRSRGIAVPGFGAQRFTAAIPWMTDIWLGNEVDVGRRVLIVGGGNVAVDVARTARRLGADHVAMACLESREEMPAEPHEVELAEAEGIRLYPRHALKRVINRDGSIAMVEMMKVVSVFDEQGRFNPAYDPSRIRTLKADMVILSIGQAPDRSWARGAQVRTDERGRVVADRQTHQSSHDRIFLAGESLRGPGSAIEAVADGHRAAEVVSRFLRTDQVTPPAEEQSRPLEPYPPETAEKLRELSTSAEEPQPFAAAEPMMSEREARREGDRCLGCMAGASIDSGQCAWCLTCYRVCPLDAVEIDESMTANPVRCQACGLCASLCPGGAIELSSWRFDERDGKPALPTSAPSGERSLEIACRHGEHAGGDDGPSVALPCPARLKAADLVGFLAQGYRQITLRPCAESDCKYGRAWANVRSLTEFVNETVSRVWPEARVELEPAEPREASVSPAGEKR